MQLRLLDCYFLNMQGSIPSLDHIHEHSMRRNWISGYCNVWPVPLSFRICIAHCYAVPGTDTLTNKHNELFSADTWSHYTGQLNYKANICQGHLNADFYGTMMTQTLQLAPYLVILMSFEVQNIVQTICYIYYLSLVQNGLMKITDFLLYVDCPQTMEEDGTVLWP